ncbi:conserved hypothetical protein [Nostocoides japonicum T1-X7]|uniref:MobA-like NTP transferase domain-containing protein n=1 Tax=Nostocoides japonicum T1-X7 TaxID=1194083 RepID=A0A077LT88_9MICO|nr:NTP transferase domain-containing protein [Tetrasphaera japonica]CCH76623.1 conserved hypothetical protein [Tetrasphaera japonica T1-X7]
MRNQGGRSEGITGSATAIVLAGGGARRFGGDKLGAAYAETTVLDHLLATIPPDWPVVCVGPRRATVRDVDWVREEPVRGGPLAGIAAAVPLARTDVTVVVAGDMPQAGHVLPRLAARLGRAPDTVEGVVGADPAGRENPLLAAYRTRALRAVLPECPSGLPARTLLALRHRVLAVTAEEARDIDTPEDLFPQRS